MHSQRTIKDHPLRFWVWTDAAFWGLCCVVVSGGGLGRLCRHTRLTMGMRRRMIARLIRLQICVRNTPSSRRGRRRQIAARKYFMIHWAETGMQKAEERVGVRY
jgi:hypothetical protein